MHEIRIRIYEARRDQELSLMARGIFGEAAQSSRDHLSGDA
ncbi:MAG: hypothetical protein R3E83_24515 [Burkholderiaceae bacterium]